MRAIFLIIATTAILVESRPDLTIGYNPNAPKDNYDGPTPDHDAFGVRSPNSGLDATVATGSNYNSIGTEGAYTQGIGGGSSFGPSVATYQQSTSGGGDYQSSQSGFGQSSGPTVATNQQPTGFFTNTGPTQSQFISPTSSVSSTSTFGAQYPTQSQQTTIGSTSYSSGSNYDQQSALPPIITKSFYFESAPEEPEEENAAPRFVPIGRAHKNYKVIFIKAPTYGFNSQVIPIVPPNEEKTIIYVLSKRPEVNQNIELPEAPTTEAAKPDVFFIKYKSEKEAEDAQQKIQTIYEQNTDVEGDARFDDGHLQSIANAAVANVISSSSSHNSGSYSSQATLTTRIQPETSSVTSSFGTSSAYNVDTPTVSTVGTSYTPNVGASSTSSSSDSVSASTNNVKPNGFTVLTGGHSSSNDEDVAESFGGHSINHEASNLEPEYLPPNGPY